MQHILFRSSRVALLFTLFFVTAFGHESTHFYSSDVFTFPVFDDNGMEIQAPQQIPGAWTALRTDRRGASQTIHAQGLTPGDVVTSWWVVFNYPEFCTDGVCNEDDVLPFPGNPEAVVSVLYSDGRIVDENGAANFWDRLSVGDDSNAMFGPGLINATTAEIHFVLRTHGPVVAQHLQAQISSYGGGCDRDPSPCADIQFSIFKQTEASETEAEETYGKVVIVWDPKDGAPIGSPFVSLFHSN